MVNAVKLAHLGLHRGKDLGMGLSSIISSQVIEKIELFIAPGIQE
jgi:hypothetical protein